MSKTIYLYLKTHNKTGLKYLGKTIYNPFKYNGSGKYWLKHLKKHGNDITTKILKECDSESEIKKWGLYYSNKWDIVNSNEFANLTEETGNGGICWQIHPCLGKSKTKEIKNKISKSLIGVSQGNPNPHSEKTKQKIIKTKSTIQLYVKDLKFDSLSLAAKYFNISKRTLYNYYLNQNKIITNLSYKRNKLLQQFKKDEVLNKTFSDVGIIFKNV